MTTDASAPGTRSPAVAVRGLEPGDEVAVHAEMLAAFERGEYEGMEQYQVEHSAWRLAANPGACAVAVADGRIVGWINPTDDDIKVTPAYRRRGVGRMLVRAGCDIAAEQGRANLRLHVPRRDGCEGFATACGMEYESSLWQMRLSGEALAAVPDPAFPATATVRTLQVGLDEPPFVALVNRIFIDHPSPIALALDEVRRIHALPSFDPSTVVVVEDGSSGAMVGFCRVHPYTTADGVPSGEIRLLGVDRSWRGRGLGRAVACWGVAELRRRGARSVTLAVEGENEVAIRLYADLGFRFGVEWPHWTLSALPASS